MHRKLWITWAMGVALASSIYAQDIAEDTVIHQRVSLEEWIESREATDFNEDGVIDRADYAIWVIPDPKGPQPLPYEEWIASDMASDINGDGATGEDDYKQWVSGPIIMPLDDSGRPEPEPFSVDMWLESDEATDLNGDGEMDEDDFALWQGPIIIMPLDPDIMPIDSEEGEAKTLTLGEWLETPDATDLNDDGEMDEDDYILWLANPFIGVTAVSNESWGTIKQSMSR